MGAALDKTSHQQPSQQKEDSGWGFEIPAKNTHYAVPETVLDCMPEWQGNNNETTV